jgi:hypothetical protein
MPYILVMFAFVAGFFFPFSFLFGVHVILPDKVQSFNDSSQNAQMSTAARRVRIAVKYRNKSGIWLA